MVFSDVTCTAMRLIVYFITAVLASFVTLTSKDQCQAFDSTLIPKSMDDADDEFHELSPEEFMYQDDFSSPVVTLQNESPKDIAQKMLLLNSKTVEELNLDSNGLTSLPDTILHLSKVESISLMNNGISDIDSISLINYMPRLRNLVLSHNPLKSLHGLLARRIEHLEAGFCEIQDIEGVLPSSLPMLKTLNLTGNPLGTIHEIISDTLTHLILYNCTLNHLHYQSFLGLTNLTHLNLEKNGLITMPDKIFLGKHKLRYLNLGDNHFKNLKTTWFSDMPNLEDLYLYKNEITSIDQLDFNTLPALSKLDLAGNKLTTFPNLVTAAIDVNFSRNSIKNKRVWDLSKMAKLRRLDLSHNRLEGKCDAFRSMSLGILILGYNKLTILKEECISDLPNLSDISLKGNKISKAISPAIFKNNPYLINMELDDNPWSCNCTQLFPLYFYIASGQKTQTTHLICHSPKNASGHTWWEFCKQNWRELMADQDYLESGTMWVIVMSAGFGACVIFGTMVYITYTFKNNRSSETVDNTI